MIIAEGPHLWTTEFSALILRLPNRLPPSPTQPDYTRKMLYPMQSDGWQSHSTDAEGLPTAPALRFQRKTVLSPHPNGDLEQEERW